MRVVRARSCDVAPEHRSRADRARGPPEPHPCEGRSARVGGSHLTRAATHTLRLCVHPTSAYWVSGAPVWRQMFVGGGSFGVSGASRARAPRWGLGGRAGAHLARCVFPLFVGRYSLMIRSMCQRSVLMCFFFVSIYVFDYEFRLIDMYYDNIFDNSIVFFFNS